MIEQPSEEKAETKISEAHAEEVGKRFTGTPVEVAYQKETQYLTLTILAGREKRAASFRNRSELDAALAFPLEELNLVGDYAAICSYKGQFIEALIEPIFPPSSFSQHEVLFGVSVLSDQPRKPITIKSDGGVVITLQLASRQFRALAPFVLGLNRNILRREGMTITLMVSNARFSTNEEANALLRRTADAVFLQVDLISNLALGLTRIRDRNLERGARAKRGDLRVGLQFPTHEFQQEAMAYYWFARGARGAPHFQFLSYYQVLEFYYSTYTDHEACRRVAQILKDPTFRIDREADVARILAATEIRQQAGERDQLKLTLTTCVNPAEFRDWLNEDEFRLKALTTKEGFAISKQLIPIKDPSSNLLEVAALRIYDIRCRIVHTGADAPTQTSNILPYSPEARQLRHDIEMTAFLARKVLIANSAPLRIMPSISEALKYGDEINGPK